MIAVLTHGCYSLPKPKDDIYPLLHPTMHCWTPSSDLYVGCEEGHLLMINTETLKVTVLQKVEEFPVLGKKRLCLGVQEYSFGVSFAYPSRWWFEDP